LIIPNTYGVPVALCGVPKTELAAADDVLDAAGELALVELVELAGLVAAVVELLELQPAAVSASAARAMAAAPSGL
jgi:hypothetical protein